MFIGSLLLGFGLVAPVQDLESTLPDDASTGQAFHPLANVVVIGASMSAGFGLSGELGTPFNLADMLDLALIDEDTTMHGLGSGFFFRDPHKLGAGQVERAIALEPTLVIAIDFPFWYGYGNLRGCESRLGSLERGLAQLDALECPILIGDFPDMSSAAGDSNALRRGEVLLHNAQVPSPECLLQLNERLKSWARERERVHVYELSAYTEQQRSDEPLRMRGNVYDSERKGTLLQRDRLHPTYRGTAAIVLSALDALVKAGVVEERAVKWDAHRLEQAVWRATETERVERRRKRAERDARRKARKKSKAREDADEAGWLSLAG